MGKKSSLKILHKLLALAIILIIIFGAQTITSGTFKLFKAPEKINILRPEIPWNQPLSSVVIMLNADMLRANPQILHLLNINLFIFRLIKSFIFVPLLVILLWQLRKMIKILLDEKYFIKKASKIIRNLSLLVGCYVIINFILYQLIPQILPLSYIEETINFIPVSESIWQNFIAAIDFKMLFGAVLLFTISQFYRAGQQLKAETDLTI